MSAANDQAKLKKRLEALLKIPENQSCADCRKRGPRWASANLGVFICIECSGIHRNLGVHISFVRSVNLDSWTKAQVDFMEEWGNKRANEYFEGNVPASVIRPKEGDPVRVVERFIRDKYEHRRYLASSVPPKSAAVTEEPPASARRASTITATTAPPAATKTTRLPAAASVPIASGALSSAPAAAPDLLNLIDDEPAVAPAPTFEPSASNSAGFGFGTASADFGAFSSAPSVPVNQGGFTAFDSPVRTAAPAQPVSASNDFMDFMAAPVLTPSANPAAVQATTVPPQAPPKPQASADAILSLYSAGGASRGGGPMMMMGSGPMGGGPAMMGGHGGMHPTHMGHINTHNPHPPMLHMQAPQAQPHYANMNMMMGGGQTPVNPFQPTQGGVPPMAGSGVGMGMGMGMGYPVGGQVPINPFQNQAPQHMGLGGMYPAGQPYGYQQQQQQQQQAPQMAPANPFGGLGIVPNQQQQQQQQQQFAWQQR